MANYDTIKTLLDNIQQKASELLDLIDGNSCSWRDICATAEPNQPNTSSNTEQTLYAITKVDIDKLAKSIIETK